MQLARMIDVTDIFVYHNPDVYGGPVAEWLCSGLQNRVHRFNSGPGLHLMFFVIPLLVPSTFPHVPSQKIWSNDNPEHQ